MFTLVGLILGNTNCGALSDSHLI